jgi:hypothetical protein
MERSYFRDRSLHEITIVNNNTAKAIGFLASIPCRIQIDEQEVLLGPQGSALLQHHWWRIT